VRDLCARVLPFASVLAGSGFDDLTGLDRIIGDARIVALGEASHGTAEFFAMKHRLLEYLVERKVSRSSPSREIGPRPRSPTVSSRPARATPAPRSLPFYFWTWQTEEVAALLHGMRDYNVTRGERPVPSFTGFDMQTPNVAMKRVIEFIDRTGGPNRDAVRALYDGMEKLEKWGSQIAAAENAQLADRASKALVLIEAQREMLVMASTLEEFCDIRQAARIVQQAFARRAGIAGSERDRAMAENVRWLIEEAFPGQKIVIWAHNGHVGTGMGGSEKSLGDHLRERYHDQMVVMGFASEYGSEAAEMRRICGLVAATRPPILNRVRCDSPGNHSTAQ
jgi:erythromycin esterase